MKLSSRVDYTLSCILRVADKYEKKKPVSVGYIAKKERLEADYVEQLLIMMKRAGVLKSVRGRKGGYILKASPREISAEDVVRAIDGEVLELVCFRKKGRKNRCIHLDDCRIRDFWMDLRGAMETFLRKGTLDKLLLLRRKEKCW